MIFPVHSILSGNSPASISSPNILQIRRRKYYATIYDGREQFVSVERKTDSIIDKIGSGDTFMAGLIYGKLSGLNSQETIEFAAAAAFNKLFIKGDATTSTVEDIMKGFKNYA